MIHHMNLQSRPFDMIASGKKTIELRLFDEKRQRIKIGDQILFTCSTLRKQLLVNVKNLFQFETFTALYKALPLDKCGYLPHELSIASPKDMMQYYSQEEESKYGVIGIEIELASRKFTKNILFDLDGTLTDSGQGIMKCAKLALAHYGLPIPDDETMRTFVGPPLSHSFRKHGVPEDKIEEAIHIYRNRYIVLGMYENTLYPGITELLQTLTKQGHRLFVATSKPEAMAITILEHFDLAQYFDKICGAVTDNSRCSKEDVIAHLLTLTGNHGHTVMVGDTIYDVMGAKVNSLPVVGVTWGYGDVEEMQNAGARIVNTLEELHFVLNMENAC